MQPNNLTNNLINKPTQWQELIITSQKQYAEDISNWLQLKGATSITILDNNEIEEPIYEPPIDTTPLWDKIKISALFDHKINFHNLINQLNYDFSTEIVETYSQKIINYDLDQVIKNYTFEPVAIADKLWIYPYNKYPNNDQQDRYFINLEPGLAFGSGEHPTTQLCLEWLCQNFEYYNNHNSIVIDYGSGSGILSLAAVKLGAASVLAVDNDPQALLATTENARRNNIADKISAFFPNELPLVQADCIVANILANPLIELAPIIVNHLKIGGKLVLSGILNEQTDFVALSYMNCGITLSEIKRKGAWVRIVGEK
jgi:ribosomal protein L11 methyltransferase